MAVNCVRSTIIEEYHAKRSLSDADMMAFNKEVGNKQYTFLVYVSGDDRDAFLSGMELFHSHDWNAPEIEESFAESAIALGTAFRTSA